jgi:hypothetical protein
MSPDIKKQKSGAHTTMNNTRNISELTAKLEESIGKLFYQLQ